MGQTRHQKHNTNTMIPFLTRYLFGLPRTLANQNIVRAKLRALGRFCAILAGTLILVAEVLVIIHLTFSL